MGASASCLPEQLDEPTARGICGSQWFDQEHFDLMKDPTTGTIPRASLEKLSSGQRHRSSAVLWSMLEHGWSHQIEVPFPEVPPPITPPTGPVVLVDAIWLIKLARKNEAVLKAYGSRSRPSSAVGKRLMAMSEGGEDHQDELGRLKAKLAAVDRAIVPCRQELPMDAIIDPADVDREYTDIFCISCPWFSPQHPDPHGFHLREIAPVLELYMRLEKRRVVVFWEWMSCFQPTYFSPTCHPPSDYPEMTDEALDGTLDEWGDEPGSPVGSVGSVGSPGSNDSGSVRTKRKEGWTRCTDQEKVAIQKSRASLGDWFANRATFVLVQDEPPEAPGHEIRLEIDLVLLEDHPPTVEDGGDEFAAYMEQHFGIRLVDSNGASRRLEEAKHMENQTHQELQSIGAADDITDDGEGSAAAAAVAAVTSDALVATGALALQTSGPTPGTNFVSRQVWGEDEQHGFDGEVSLESSAAYTSKYYGVGFGSIVVENIADDSLGAAAHIKAGFGIAAVDVIASNSRYVVNTLDGLELLLKKLRTSMNTCDLIFQRARNCETSAWCYFERAIAEFNTPDERLLSINLLKHNMRHWKCHALFHRSITVDDIEHAFVERYKFNGGKRDPISWSDFVLMWRSFGSGYVMDLRSPRVNPPLRPDLFDAMMAKKEFFRGVALSQDTDKVLVSQQYREVFNAMFKETDVFNFSRLGWSFDVGVLYNETGCGLSRDNIKELDLSYNIGLTGHLDHLGELPVLEVFKLAGCTGLTGTLKDLSLCPQLMVLHLEDCSKLEGTIEALTSCVHLVELDMHGCGGLTGSLEPIMGCAKLMKLNMAKCNGIKGALPGNVLRLITDKAANFTGCEGPFKVASDISDIASIKTIDLSMLGPRIYGSLDSFTALTALESLTLAGCHKIRSTLEPFANCTSLVDVDVHGCDNFSGSLMPLSASMGLQRLNISGCNGSLVDQNASMKKRSLASEKNDKAVASWKRAKKRVSAVMSMEATKRTQAKYAGDSSGIKGALPGNIVRLISKRNARFDDCKGPFFLTEYLRDIADIKSVNLTMLGNRLEGTIEPLKALSELETLVLRGCAKISGSLEPLSAGCENIKDLNLYGCRSIKGIVSARTITWLLGVPKRNILACGELDLYRDLRAVELREIPQSARGFGKEDAAAKMSNNGSEEKDGSGKDCGGGSNQATKDDAKVLNKGAGRHHDGDDDDDDDDDDDGSLNGILPPSGPVKVCIAILGASGILAADKGGTSDPYAIAELVTTDSGKPLKPSRSTKTKTIKKTLSPTWNEDAVTWKDVTEDVSTLSLKLAIYDADMLSSELLGGITVPLTTFNEDSAARAFSLLKMGKMKNDATGSVEFSCWVDASDKGDETEAMTVVGGPGAPRGSVEKAGVASTQDGEVKEAEGGALCKEPTVLHRFDLVNIDTLTGWREALPTLPGFGFSLKLLNLSGTNLDSLLPLRACKGNLEVLNLYGCLHARGDLDPLEGFKQLRLLNLEECRALVGTLKPLESCVSLTRANFRNCTNIVGDIEPFVKLEKLTHLTIACTSGRMGIYGSMKTFLKCAALERLDLRNCDIESIEEVLPKMDSRCQVHFIQGERERSLSGSVDPRQLEDDIDSDLDDDDDYDPGY